MSKLHYIVFSIVFFVLLVSCKNSNESNYDPIIAGKTFYILEDTIGDTSSDLDHIVEKEEKQSPSYVDRLDNGFLKVKKSFVLLNENDSIVYQCDSFVTDSNTFDHDIFLQEDTVFTLSTSLNTVEDQIFMTHSYGECCGCSTYHRVYGLKGDTMKMITFSELFMNDDGNQLWSSCYYPMLDSNQLIYLENGLKIVKPSCEKHFNLREEIDSSISLENVFIWREIEVNNEFDKDEMKRADSLGNGYYDLSIVSSEEITRYRLYTFVQGKLKNIKGLEYVNKTE